MIKDEKICSWLGLYWTPVGDCSQRLTQVLGVDSNKLVINSLKSGTAHFYEPEIQEQFDSVTINQLNIVFI